MRFDADHQSNDVDDRRGQGGGQGAIGGGAIGIIISLLMRTRYGWILIIPIVGFFVVRQLGLFHSGSDAATPGDPHALAAGDTQAHFVAFVLDDTQTFWEGELGKQGKRYPHAKLILFTDQTQTGCGSGDAATGPFYCPTDASVYIDLGFFQIMNDQLGAKGQFPRAYVVAHEIGHHVQNLLGISVKTERGQVVGQSGSSVRLELQADCYAGIWAHSAASRNLLEQGDIESALTAASRIGDDTLQKEESGRVRPDKFTHGTADQRRRWLKRGYDSGLMSDCDTFGAATL